MIPNETLSIGTGPIRETHETRASAEEPRRIPQRAVVSWVLYDLANTIFSMGVVSMYFSMWVRDQVGADRADLVTGAITATSGLIFLVSPLLGAMTDRARTRMPFLIASTVICVAFTMVLARGGFYLTAVFPAAAVGILGLASGFLYTVASLAGFALGGIWDADRPYMLRLTPPSRLGEFYGSYGMVGRFSAVAGPLLWGAVSWLAISVFGVPAHIGQGIAVLTLLVLIVVSYVILQPVSDVPPTGRAIRTARDRGSEL